MEFKRGCGGRTGKLGKKELSLVEQDGIFYGMADRVVCVEGSDKDDVWRRLQNDAGRSDPRYFGFDDAKNRFLKFFPGGFHSDGYEDTERQYKLAAKELLDEHVPLQDAAEGSGFGEEVLRVFQKTNLVSPFEKTRVAETLRGPGADGLVQAAARFTLKPDKENLHELKKALEPRDCAKWTVATYLPFLWQPDRHMFLKPEVTKNFAARVGHRFTDDYSASLELPVYESLLDLVDQTQETISDMQPVDRIDIQSFIYVIGEYREGQEEPRP